MRSGINMLAIWFGSLMILIVMAGAVAITFTDLLSDRLYGKKRVFFVILLVAYAIYRGFRLYYLYKQNQRAKD